MYNNDILKRIGRIARIAIIPIVFSFSLSPSPLLGEVPGECGDANGDERVNVADVQFLVEYVFEGGYPPDPLESGDVNFDEVVNVQDIVYLLDAIFRYGPLPDCGGALQSGGSPSGGE